MNALNESIQELHFINNEAFDLKDLADHCQSEWNVPVSTIMAKVHFHFVPSKNGDRLLFGQALQWSMKSLADKIVLFSNLDIYFDDSLRELATHQQNTNELDTKTVYYLSRYELDESHNAGTQCDLDTYHGSHDTFIFKPRTLDPSITSKLQIELGTWGTEYHVLHHFNSNGYSVKNPCLQITSWHCHQTEHKNRVMPTLMPLSKFLAKPCYLKDSNTKKRVYINGKQAENPPFTNRSTAAKKSQIKRQRLANGKFYPVSM